MAMREMMHLFTGLIVVVVAVVVLVLGPGDPFDRGLDLLAVGQVEGAIASFSRVSEMHPLYPYARLYLAQGYLEAGEPGRAVSVLAGVGIPFEVDLLLGRAHLALGNLALAEAKAAEALHAAILSEERAAALSLTLELAETRADHVQQVESILQLLEVLPVRFIGYEARALRTRLAEAAVFLDPVDDRDRQALFDYAIYLARVDPAGARRILLAVLPFLTGTDKHEAEFQIALITSTRLGDRRSAEGLFEGLIARGPQEMRDRSRYFAAHNLIALGRRAEAEEGFARIIEWGNAHWAGLSIYWLMRLYLHHDEAGAWRLLQGARQDLLAAADYHRALFRLFFHHFSAQDYIAALPVIDLLLNLPLDDQSHPRALFWRYRLAAALNQYDRWHLERLGNLYPLSYYALLARDRGWITGPLFTAGERRTRADLVAEASSRLRGEEKERLAQMVMFADHGTADYGTADHGTADYGIWRLVFRRLALLAPYLPEQIYLELKSEMREEEGELRLAINYAELLADSADVVLLPRSLLTRIYPRHYQKETGIAAARFDAEEALIHAIIRRESAFERMALSRSDAHGLMQIIPTTGADIAGRLGLDGFTPAHMFDPQTNITMGTSYITRQLARFADLRLAIAAYHGGSGNVTRWLAARPDVDIDLFIELIPAASTRDYVKSVYQALLIYRAI